MAQYFDNQDQDRVDNLLNPRWKALTDVPFSDIKEGDIFLESAYDDVYPESGFLTCY